MLNDREMIEESVTWDLGIIISKNKILIYSTTKHSFYNSWILITNDTVIVYCQLIHK